MTFSNGGVMPDLSRCGRCGNAFKPKKGARYNSLCDACHVPHQLMSRIEVGKPEFRCDYCGQTGTMAHLDSFDCTYVYPPCASCKQHPYCARDCAAIGELLNRDDIYVAGFGHDPN